MHTPRIPRFGVSFLLFSFAILGFFGSFQTLAQNTKTIPLSETSVGAGVSESIAMEGDIVFVAKHEDGVAIVDVFNPLSPTLIGTIDPDGPTNNTVNVWDVQVLNGVLYVFNKGSAIDPSPGKGNWTGVYIYDITNPLAPVEIGAVVWGKYPGHHLGAWTESGEVGLINGVPHIFVCSKISSMVEIFDVSNPSIPVFVSTVLRPQWQASQETVYQNNKLYTAWGTEGFTIHDVSVPSAPVRLGRQVYTGVATPQGGLRTLSPTPDGLYLVTGEYTNSADVRLWNISNPAAITQVATWRLGANAWLWTVRATNDYVYVCHLEEGIRILDIRSRTSLTPAGYFDPDPAPPVRTWAGIADVVMDGLTLFAVHETRGVFAVQHDPNLPPPDVITISTASYRTSRGELTVYATSSAQPTPTLTLAGVGTMTWNARARRYEKVVRLTTAPASVTVTSTGRGTATKTVTVR